MKKLLLFNASALKEMICPQRAKYTILNGYKEPEIWNDTFYGTCYHKYQSVFAESNNNFAKAMKAAELLWRSIENKLSIRKVGYGKDKAFLNLQHLRATCVDHYDKVFPTEDFIIQKCSSICDDDKVAENPLVELKFHVPYYSDDEIDVVLTGTIDKLGKFKNGAWAIGDYKTTSSWDWRDYLERYALNAQLRFYLLLLKCYASMYPSSIFAEICKTNQVGAFIDGVFLSNTKPSEFRRGQVHFFKDEDMNQFESMLTKVICEVVDAYKNPEVKSTKLGILNGACNNIYGKKCPYWNACAAPNETIAGHILKNNFHQSEYGMEVYGGDE